MPITQIMPPTPLTIHMAMVTAACKLPPPFISAPKNGGREAIFAELTLVQQGQIIRYEIDFDRLEAAVTPQTTLFDIGAIRHELTRLLGVPVDVLTPQALPEKFRAAVLSQARSL